MSDDRFDSMVKIRDNIESAFFHKHTQNGLGFIDCCKKYKFVRDFDTYNFNKKVNYLGITYLVLKDKYDLSTMIVSSIGNAIRYNSNIVIGIKGITGSGKSELAKKIALISKKINKKEKNREVKIHICWTPEDLFETLKILKKGDIIMKDESPRAFGKGARTEKWSIDNALAVIRKMENTIIFCDPLDIKIDICDLYLETAGMCLKTRTNRFMVLNKERMYFGHIYSTLHTDKEFRIRYEREKDLFVKKTIKLAGKFLSGLRKDKIKDADFIDDKQEKHGEEEEGNLPIESIEYLKNHIKNNNNRITVKEYSVLLDKSKQVALRLLRKYEKEKQLKWWKEEKGTLVFYNHKVKPKS